MYDKPGKYEIVFLTGEHRPEVAQIVKRQGFEKAEQYALDALANFAPYTMALLRRDGSEVGRVTRDNGFTPPEHPCGLYAGKEHEEHPPAAVVEVAMSWTTTAGEDMNYTQALCRPCYDDKAREFKEHAQRGENSLLEITMRFGGGEKLPARVGRKAA